MSEDATPADVAPMPRGTMLPLGAAGTTVHPGQSEQQREHQRFTVTGDDGAPRRAAADELPKTH